MCVCVCFPPKRTRWDRFDFYPIESMYGIFTYTYHLLIYHQNPLCVGVGKYIPYMDDMCMSYMILRSPVDQTKCGWFCSDDPWISRIPDVVLLKPTNPQDPWGRTVYLPIHSWES